MDNKQLIPDDETSNNPNYPSPPPYERDECPPSPPPYVRDECDPPPTVLQVYNVIEPGYPAFLQQQNPQYPIQIYANTQMVESFGNEHIININPNTQPQNNTDTPVDDAHFGATFSEKKIRQNFVRKVYSILFLQLLFTFSVVALFVFEEHVKEFVQNHIGIYLISYLIFLITYFILLLCPAARQQYPRNVICLAIFTLAMTYLVATISSFHDTSIVLIATGICAGTTLGITLFSMWTKYDFTGCGPYLCVACWILFFFGIACIATYGDTTTVYSTLGALLMMMFLIYDTQMIMGGKRYQLSSEEYVAGALQLYVDIVNMFIMLLRCGGGCLN